MRVYRDFLKTRQRRSISDDNFPSSFYKQDIVAYTTGLIASISGLKQGWWRACNVESCISARRAGFGLRPTRSLMSRSLATIPTDSWERAKFEAPAERWADMSKQWVWCHFC